MSAIKFRERDVMYYLSTFFSWGNSSWDCHFMGSKVNFEAPVYMISFGPHSNSQRWAWQVLFQCNDDEIKAQRD